MNCYAAVHYNFPTYRDLTECHITVMLGHSNGLMGHSYMSRGHNKSATVISYVSSKGRKLNSTPSTDYCSEVNCFSEVAQFNATPPHSSIAFKSIASAQ